MKIIIALACLLAVACANEDAKVLRLESDVGIEAFKYALELDNSNKQEQHGSVDKNGALSVEGQYGHTSPEGEAVSIQYIANELGFQVLSANPPLPTPPPTPDYILRAIEYINAHPSKDAQA